MSSIAPDVSGGGHGQPATVGFQITPSDVDSLQYATRAIFVGGNGNISLRTLGGSIIVLTAVVAGTVLPIRATKVFFTGTTATNLCGLL